MHIITKFLLRVLALRSVWPLHMETNKIGISNYCTYYSYLHRLVLLWYVPEDKEEEEQWRKISGEWCTLALDHVITVLYSPLCYRN